MSKSKRSFNKEYVLINGVKHFVLYYEVPGTDVLIYLHGGPGQATSNLAYLTDQDITTHTTVYYDQRGAGKTLLKNWRSTRDVTLDQLLNDLRALIAYVKARYRRDKVALLGHSWGSLLGTEYIKRYPEDVLCYIGVGQMVNTKAGERAGLDELTRRVDRGNPKDIRTIHELQDYPDNTHPKHRMNDMIKLRRLQAKYGIGADVKALAKVFVRSPIFTPLDFVAMALGTFVNKKLEETDFEYDTSGFTQYPVPIYYVLGVNDWQVPSVVAAEYHATINAPRKAIYWIEEAGHVPNLENTEAFNNAISQVLADARSLG